MANKDLIKILIVKISNITLPILAGIYVIAYLSVEFLVQNPIRHYNFCVFLSLSGIYFAWYIGGRRTMFYVAFFNIFFVFIFSKLLWDQGIIVYGGRLFLGRSFLTMYVFTLFLILLMVFKKSPADLRQEEQRKTIDEARRYRQNLEFMVASRKLKADLIEQANLVKDELQIIEGAWQSNVHSIINDLSTVKEQELYDQIILPFQQNIIQHLRDLESGLTFDLQPVPLPDLLDLIVGRIKKNKKMGSYEAAMTVNKQGWIEVEDAVLVDKNKVWDMVLNILRNSQAALDLQRIEMLRLGTPASFHSKLLIDFNCRDSNAVIKVVDNGGGVSPEHIDQLYKEPVPSRKRGGKNPGQGTLFVKFFTEHMGIIVSAENTLELGDQGLCVVMKIPLCTTESSLTREVRS